MRGHLGIEKCMIKVRDSVFWPGISNDIRETVRKMWDMSGKFQSSQTSWKCELCASSHMAHIGHRSVLLEQDRLPGDQRLLLQIPDC